MAFIPPYNPKDYSDPDVGFRKPGLYLRPAIIRSINVDKGLATIEWMDFPGIRQDVDITQPQQGIFQMPTIGAMVLVGFDQKFGAKILRYLPVGYAQQIIDQDIWRLRSGELMLNAYIENPVESVSYPTPESTGTLFYMNNIGDVEISTASGESWIMDNDDNEIIQKSMNYHVSTEAGVLQFGLIKRTVNDTSSIISTLGIPIEKDPSTTPEGLTEFRLRILDTADANALTDPKVDDNPLVEMTLGTKVDNAGKKELSTAGEDIIIQLKTRNDQGFEFTVDNVGNLTVNCKGNVSFKTAGDTSVEVGGQTTVKSTGKIRVDAPTIELGGTTGVVLDSFLTSYDTHFHSTSQGPTGPPMFPSSPSHRTTTVKAG